MRSAFRRTTATSSMSARKTCESELSSQPSDSRGGRPRQRRFVYALSALPRRIESPSAASRTASPAAPNASLDPLRPRGRAGRSRPAARTLPRDAGATSRRSGAVRFATIVGAGGGASSRRFTRANSASTPFAAAFAAAASSAPAPGRRPGPGRSRASPRRSRARPTLCRDRPGAPRAGPRRPAPAAARRTSAWSGGLRSRTPGRGRSRRPRPRPAASRATTGRITTRPSAITDGSWKSRQRSAQSSGIGSERTSTIPSPAAASTPPRSGSSPSAP